MPVTHNKLFLRASYYFKCSKTSDKGLIHNIGLLVLVEWTLLSPKAQIIVKSQMHYAVCFQLYLTLLYYLKIQL